MHDLKQSAELCALAYLDHKHHPGAAIWSDNTYGFIHRHKGTRKVDIVIRGTDDPLDAIKDAMMHQVDVPYYGLIHAGSHGEWVKLQPAINSLLRDGDIVTFHGHSLGGMVATEGTACYAEAYGATAVTFGQPMVFGADNHKWDHLDIIRVRNPKDRVPLQPTRWAAWLYKRGCRKIGLDNFADAVAPYKHIGKVVWTGKGESYVWPWQYQNHPIKKYIEAL